MPGKWDRSQHKCANLGTNAELSAEERAESARHLPVGPGEGNQHREHGHSQRHGHQEHAHGGPC